MISFSSHELFFSSTAHAGLGQAQQLGLGGDVTRAQPGQLRVQAPRPFSHHRDRLLRPAHLQLAPAHPGRAAGEAAAAGALDDPGHVHYHSSRSRLHLLGILLLLCPRPRRSFLSSHGRTPARLLDLHVEKCQGTEILIFFRSEILD